MYRAKDRGRNRVEIYQAADSSIVRRFEDINVAGALLVKLFGHPKAESAAFSDKAGRVRDIDALPASDFRRNTPRFTGLNWKRNLEKIDAYVALAQKFGRDPCELALAWALAQGEHVLTIPGTRYVENLRHDARAADKPLTAEEGAALAALLPPGCRL